MDSHTMDRFPSFSLFRLFALSLILVTTIFVRQDFFGSEVVTKIYFVICVSFFISIVSTVFWTEVKKVRFFTLYQMSYDVLLTSYLIFQTGINESIFLFLYILNIIHAAIIFELAGSLIVSGLAGVIYGMIYYINKDTTSDNQFYTLFYNELFFLLTGLLSGQLMDELRRQSRLLQTEKSEVERLRVLTDRLMNNLPSGVMLVDRDDYVESMNESLLSILETKVSSNERMKYYELIPDIEGVRARWFSMSEQEKLKFSFRYRTSSREKILSLQIVFLSEEKETEAKNEKKIPPRAELIFVIQDISQLQQIEDKQQMDSRLAAVGQLAAGIAHEIRTPLASISGSIETLLKNIKPQNPDDEKLVSISLREIRRLDKLITEFLMFVKPTENSFSKLNVKAVLDEVIISISNVKNPAVVAKITNDVSPQATIQGDNEKLKQVFLNLFMNSIEAATTPIVDIRVESRTDRMGVTLLIKDNGPGVSDSIRDKIFNPFFTTKKNGTGLGLANVAQIIKRHGGDIRSIHSTKGAAFEIKFPESEA